jgi:hypothetical protein
MGAEPDNSILPGTFAKELTKSRQIRLYRQPLPILVAGKFPLAITTTFFKMKN